MLRLKEFEPIEIFGCHDYIYAKETDGHSFHLVISYGLGLKPPLKVLDLGCGLGTMVRKFQQLGYEAYGVESRPTLSADNRAIFFEDARKTHFPDSYFDIVTERLTFNQLIGLNLRPDVVEEIIKEVARIIKKGGYLISRAYPGDLAKSGIYNYAEGPIKTGFGDFMFSNYRF